MVGGCLSAQSPHQAFEVVQTRLCSAAARPTLDRENFLLCLQRGFNQFKVLSGQINRMCIVEHLEQFLDFSNYHMGTVFLYANHQSSDHCDNLCG